MSLITSSSIDIPKSKFRLIHLIYLLACVKFILPFLLQNPVFEPHRDEFLYLAEAQHMAWGYLEVPPLMSVFGLLTNMMGGSLFWIKLWPALFGSLTYLLVGRLILSLGGKWFALVLGFLPFIFGYYLHVHFMFQPNFLEVYFWTLMANGLVLFIRTGKNKALYLSGIGLGLGMMSKYSVVFFAISLLLGLLLTKERKIFLNRHFYYALGIGLVIFLPNLIWQYLHGFPVIHHFRELQHQQLDKVSQAGFLFDQLLFNLPGIFIWISGWAWVSFSAEGKPYRFIGWAVFIVMTILVMAHGKSYYGMGAYPILFSFGALYLESLTAGRIQIVRFTIVAFTLITGCFIDSLALPILPPRQLANYYKKNNMVRKMGFLQWEDQKDHLLPQDYADMLSWREMTEKIAKVYDALDSTEKAQAVLDSDNYGEAGAINYYGPKYFLPRPIGDKASFLFWVPSNFYKSNIVILVTDYREIMNSNFIRGFQSAALVDSITNPYAREFGSYILLLKGPSEKFRRDWRDHYESRLRETSSF